MNALIFWDDNELQLLKPSLVLERIGKKEAKEMHERIIKSIKQIGGEFSRVADVLLSLIILPILQALY